MKNIVFVSLIALLLVSCKGQTVYVPVESVRTEYANRLEHDSIHRYDSIFVREKGDTIWLEKYRYLYRERFRTDTLAFTDTIRVPYPVVETKEIRRLSSFQAFQVWCGRIFLVILVLWCGMRWVKR